MGDTLVSALGQKGRVVIPWPIRQRHDWKQGTALIFIETDNGVEIRDRDQALTALRQSLRGPSLSEELIAERRREAATDTERP